MLKNLLTEGWLVSNAWDRITSYDEAYAVTATKETVGPVARSVLTIEKANNDGDSQVRYGQDIRLLSSQHMIAKPLYLHSQQLTPQVFARFSRNQEVCMHTKKVHNTVWRIQPTSGRREDRAGEPVNAKDAVILQHVATSQYLSNDHIPYQNGFGSEMEVSALNIATKSKTQVLANEFKGT